MKIVFMGTPDFAAVALEALAGTEHEIGYVVSQPDKAKNRGKKLLPTPVKEKAQEYGLTVLQPEKIKASRETIELLKAYEPDLVVVAAYGQLLSKEILDIPKICCVNIHASLLPRYRGAAPIQRAIMNGDEKTGITLMCMAEGMDTGDMIAKEETEIGRKSFGELHDELARMGAKLLLDNLPAFENGSFERTPQDEELACYAPMVFKNDGILDFSKTPEELERIVRGYYGAYTTLDGEVFKVWEADVQGGAVSAAPGTVTEASPDGIKVAAAGGSLIFKTVQAAGKKKMSAADYLRGSRLAEGTVFG